MIYCTLFDSNYLDKGSLMIESLLRVDKKAKIYVLCMDDLCKKILDREYRTIVTISISNFLDNDLSKIKENRSNAEFCWSCTAKLIEYILLKKGERICTYVDADLFFYSNPEPLFDEMELNNCSVQTMSHNFPRGIFKKYLQSISGKNCVEFITFKNNDDSLMLLDSWIKQCINDCSVERGGDQLYTDDWEKYSFVDISKNLGAGIAPWNVSRFKLLKSGLFDKETKKDVDIIFYHFQNLTNRERYLVKIEPYYNYYCIDKKLIFEIYLPYIKALEQKKKYFFSKYSFCPIIWKYISKDNDSEPIKTKKEFSFISWFYDKRQFVILKIIRLLRGKKGFVNTEQF